MYGNSYLNFTFQVRGKNNLRCPLVQSGEKDSWSYPQLKLQYSSKFYFSSK